jgi:hypothetical protein
MLVRTTSAAGARARWAPASSVIGDIDYGFGGGVLIQGRSDEVWSSKQKGIKKFGIEFAPSLTYGARGKVYLRNLKGWPPPLAENTPGLVWDVRGQRIVFVTLDGGRYEFSDWAANFQKDGPVLEVGLISEANWPTPLQEEVVEFNIVNMLVKGGALSKQEGDKVTALYDAYVTCPNTLWKMGKEEEDNVRASAQPRDVKSRKLEAIEKAYEAKANKECAPALAKYEEGLVSFIEQRSKERMELYNSVKTRITTATAHK